jgi:hypothetical protein
MFGKKCRANTGKLAGEVLGAQNGPKGKRKKAVPGFEPL